MRAASKTECPDQTQLLDFLNEQLTVQKLSDMDAHVSTCPDCLGRLQQLVNTRWGSDTMSMLTRSSEPRPTHFGDYEVIAEIAVGGMGSVWRVRDEAFQRDLAIKIIKPELASRSDFRARFFREAQLCARLAHPNIVPVHTQGEAADGRPFYSMKLVEGETLAQRLKQAEQRDTSQLLSIFEQVCLAMAFAHRQGVIHRDLKPLNIMVGAHGEVQVMDWGLAKDIGVGNAKDNLGTSSDHSAHPESLMETTVGDIVGTLAYMPPEQARGEVKLTCAADVFALGSMLCEVLTGFPAYHGKNLNEVMRRATTADLAEAQERLKQCDGDPTLVEITLNCLAVNPAERPQDASVLAEQLAAHRNGIERRLQQERLSAERERGAAAERETSLLNEANWERRRRRLTTFLSLAIVLTVLLVSAMTWSWNEQRRQRVQTQSMADTSIAAAQTAMQQDDFSLAEVELRRAQALLDGQPEYRGHELTALNDALDLAQRLEAVRMEYFTWSNAWFDCCTALDRYTYEFEQSNWNFETDAQEQLVKRISRSPVKHRLLAALDDWAWLVHREAQRSDDQDDRVRLLTFRDRLLRIARRSDPMNTVGNRLRDGNKWDHSPSLLEAIESIEPQDHSPELLVLVGKLLPHDDRQAFLWKCQHFHCDDFWLNAELGRALLEDAIAKLPEDALGDLPVECPPMMQAFMLADAPTPAIQSTAMQAISFYRATLVQQPEVLGLRLDLTTATALSGDINAAIAISKAAIESAPRGARAHELAEAQLQLGIAQLRTGAIEEAIASLRAAVELDSYYQTATEQLVHFLVTDGRPAEARRLSQELGLTALPDGEGLNVLAEK